jgi:hypothetical protein
MRTIRWLSLVFGISSLMTLQATAQGRPQSTPVPLAPGPLLNRAPAFSQWLISIKLASGAPGATVAVPDAQTKYDQRTQVTKTGDVRVEISVTADGRKSQKWCQGALQATIIPGVKDPEVAMAGGAIAERGNLGYTDYTKSDFPGFEWISKKNYTGTQTVEGVPCIVFHEDSADGPAAPAASPAAGASSSASAVPQGGNTAYIAADVRLPVLLVTDAGVNFYQFEAAPSAQLRLPPNVQAAFDQLQNRLRQAAAGPAAP